MPRKHHHRGQIARQEGRADRLQHRADQLGRRSARAFGVVVSLERMADLRRIIATGSLPETITKMGRVGASADAYAVDFNDVVLVAVFDRRGQSIAAFLPIGAPEITALISARNVEASDQNPMADNASA